MAAIALGAMVDALARRPLAIMFLAVNVRLTVPFLAKLFGNRDPMENSISHVFGQSTLCAAMDFPGWVEAAVAMFVVAGLMDTYALHRIYRHKCQDIQASGCIATDDAAKPEQTSISPPHSVPHAIFFVLEAIASNGFTLVAVSNPAFRTDSDTVFWHTFPYIILMFGQMFFAVYLMLCLPPESVSRRLLVTWYCIALSSMVSYIILWASVIATFVEMRNNGIKDVIHDEYDFPFERQVFFILNEYLMVTTFLLSLMLHPFGWRGMDVNSSPKSEQGA